MRIVNGLFRASQVVFGSGLASALILASNIVLARALPPSAYGDYITAFTLTNGGMFLAVFGFSQLLLQEYGRKHAFGPSIVRGALFFQIFWMIASCAGMILLMYFITLSQQARILTLLLLPILIAQATGDIASVYFQLTEQRWLAGGWIAILNFLRLVAAIVFVVGSRDIYMLPIYQSVAGAVFSIASIALTLRMLKRYAAPLTGEKVSLEIALRHIFAQSSPYAISSLMYFAIAQLPLVLFAAISGSHQAAIYSVAFLVIGTFYFVPQTLMIRYLLLKYHAIAAANRENLTSLYRQGTYWAAIAGCVFAIPAFFLVPAIITIVFGNKYDESIRLIRIMMVCIPLRFMTVNLAAIVVSGVSMWHKNCADLVGGGFAVACYLALIFINPRVGGAYAAILTEIVVLAAHYYLIERYLYHRTFGQWARRLLFK